MNLLKHIWLFMLVLWFGQIHAQSEYNGIILAINKGNTAELSKYFDNRIDISINGEANNYSKEQGEIILSKFFNELSDKELTIVKKVQNAKGLFIMGNLKTKQSNYRVFINIKQIDNKIILQEIRFEKT